MSSKADLTVSRKRALRGYLRGSRVYLAHAVAKKLYRCPVCEEPIPIGCEHVILREKRRATGRYPVHHHMHRDCVPYENLKEAEPIKPHQASRARVNRRVRR